MVITYTLLKGEEIDPFVRFLDDLDMAHYDLLLYKRPMRLFMNHNTKQYIYEWYKNAGLLVRHDPEHPIPRPRLKGFEVYEYPWFLDGEVFLLCVEPVVERHWHFDIDEFMC